MTTSIQTILQTVPDWMIVCPPLPDHPLLTMDDPDNIVDGFMFACRVEDLAAAQKMLWPSWHKEAARAAHFGHVLNML